MMTKITIYLISGSEIVRIAPDPKVSLLMSRFRESKSIDGPDFYDDGIILVDLQHVVAVMIEAP
jgi:hypothetical protein